MGALVWDEDLDMRPGSFRGRLPSGSPIIFLQAPSRNHRCWHLFGYLRWRDIRKADFNTPDAAKVVAEQWAAEWMDDLGLMPREPSRAEPA